jgi:hypothetical protein
MACALGVFSEAFMMRRKADYALGKIRDRVYPQIVAQQIEKMIFNFTTPRIKGRVLLHSKLHGSPVFCIVHFNAPDFLTLNVNQIEFLYPKSEIYVLDNGSEHENVNAAVQGLKRFNNINLFAVSTDYPNWESKIGANRLLFNHAKGLQFLLNYAAEQKDEIAVFLDQDCVLSRSIDDLFEKLGKNVLLVGVRTTNDLVHASFMILQPQRINQLFGKFSLFHDHTISPEPYQGICFKAKGKILFLEPKRHSKIPFLTSYSIQDTILAWHAWYSSRAPFLLNVFDSVSAAKYETVRKLEIEFMEKVHEETLNNAQYRVR